MIKKYVHFEPEIYEDLRAEKKTRIHMIINIIGERKRKNNNQIRYHQMKMT